METVNTKEHATATIGEIVTGDLRTAHVFRKYGIDFCCGGKKTLAQVCRDKNIDAEKLEADLNKVAGEPKTIESNADHWEADFLADYIINVHHTYVREAMPDLRVWAEKVARVHGHSHPEAVRIHELFTEIADELESHMVKEEMVLFPYIRQLCASKKAGNAPPDAAFGTVHHPITAMEHEHEQVGILFTEIEKLSNNFTPPADACNTFRALYNNLKEFENDLFLHIHLENNILFPKAEVLERELKGA